MVQHTELGCRHPRSKLELVCGEQSGEGRGRRGGKSRCDVDSIESYRKQNGAELDWIIIRLDIGLTRPCLAQLRSSRLLVNCNAIAATEIRRH